ncbi:hypothetical protein N197_03445 [Helicobacter pylori UM023]|nr:hypothetical protein N197_03445 [Helicobacter pylori UM023]
MIKSLDWFFNKQAKIIPKQVNNNCERFEWGNNVGLNGVILSKKILLI